jgi:hypothetical protein
VDPPERVRTWLATVEPTAIRLLDLQLVTDLLRMETDADQWGELMAPVASLLEDLLMVGDFESARRLVDVLLGETLRPAGYSRAAIEGLVAAPVIQHLPAQIGACDDSQFEAIVAMCTAIGERVSKPLAEALAGEEQPRVRDRLAALLRAYGPAGRRAVEKLKTSEHLGVRRAAVDLLRRLGGAQVVADLSTALHDQAPHVQQDAARALLDVGTDAAYSALEQALLGGDARSREQLIQALCAIRDGRVVRVLAYVLTELDRKGAPDAEFVRTIDSLGALRDPAAVAPLGEVLRQGRWWAPKQTAVRRAAAAAALARIGTDDAVRLLQQVAASGPRGARVAAREYLDTIGSQRPRHRGAA